MFQTLFKQNLKRFLIILFLFFYIDLIHIINNFTWEKANETIINKGSLITDSNGSQAIPAEALALPICLIVLTTVFFIILFFATYFYFQNDLEIEEAQGLLIFSAILTGVRKIYCLKCMLMGCMVTFLFLIPALFSVNAAYFIAHFIKRVKSQ